MKSKQHDQIGEGLEVKESRGIREMGTNQKNQKEVSEKTHIVYQFCQSDQIQFNDPCLLILWTLKNYSEYGFDVTLTRDILEAEIATAKGMKINI